MRFKVTADFGLGQAQRQSWLISGYRFEQNKCCWNCRSQKDSAGLWRESDSGSIEKCGFRWKYRQRCEDYRGVAGEIGS